MKHISPAGRREARWAQIEASAETDRPLPMVTIAAGGMLLEVRGPKVPSRAPLRVSRETIKAFTAASRKRLLRFLATINQQVLRVLPLFVTLTYPGEYSNDPRQWKRDLDNWLKRLRRYAPDASAVWKLEFQKRGAPHYHLLVFGPRHLDRRWIARSWAAVVGSGDARHVKAGTRVERIRSWRGVMFYAGKYLAKVVDGPAIGEVGRYWGVHNRRGLPVHMISFTISLIQLWRLKRACRRMAPHGHHVPVSSVWCRGFSIFGSTPWHLALLRVLE